MTVHSLDTARKMVEEAPDSIYAVYEFTHAISREKLWSVESYVNQGSTLRSPYCDDARLIYAEGRWFDDES
jgi:hypothetical protein